MNWQDLIDTELSNWLQPLIQVAPRLFGAVVLLIIGWFLARFLKSITQRAFRIANRFMLQLSKNKDPLQAKDPILAAQLSANIVFWAVVLVFFTLASDILGLRAFSDWLAQLVEYLPVLITGGLIIIAGFLLSRLVKDIIIASVSLDEPRQVQRLGKVIQITILTAALLTGANQIGIDVSLLVNIAVVIFAVLSGGIALSISLGARKLVENLIAVRYLQRQLQVGDRVTLAGCSGKIVAISTHSLILETEKEHIHIPASYFNEKITTVHTGDA